MQAHYPRHDALQRHVTLMEHYPRRDALQRETPLEQCHHHDGLYINALMTKETENEVVVREENSEREKWKIDKENERKLKQLQR